jgi:phosphatidylglycerol:prolipoprotein diacylglycerol transferase
MHSILFQLGPLPIKAYGLMMALGFAAAWFLAARLARGTAMRAELLADMAVWLMLAGLLGARLAYVAEHWTAEFAARPWNMIRIDQGGLMFYGGAAGAALALLIFARLHRLRPLALLDVVGAALPLGHAFGRVGCFLHGCCHGHVANGPLTVCFPQDSPAWEAQVAAGQLPPSAACSLPVWPTQLFESGANLLLCIALALLYRRQAQRRPGLVAVCYLMGYAVIRYTIEPLRGDARMTVGVWSIGQAISIAIFVVGAALAVCTTPRRAADAHDDASAP